MSTLSYLRVQLKQAERRLARYEYRKAVAETEASVHPGGKATRARLDLLADEHYKAAINAVRNLSAALAREESRLAGDPAAKL